MNDISYFAECYFYNYACHFLIVSSVISTDFTMFRATFLQVTSVMFLLVWVVQSTHLIKLSIFIHQSLQEHLRNNLKLDSQSVERLLFAYVNQIDVNFSELADNNSVPLISIELHKIFTYDPAWDKQNSSAGDIDILLDHFCYHQANERLKQNKTWDLSLLLTSDDLYSQEEADEYSLEASKTTMGISIIDGMRWAHDYGCLIVEFGVGYSSDLLKDSQQVGHPSGRVYPTRGLASNWIATHEIAHSLGVHHDGIPFNGRCDPDKYLMSPNSRRLHSINTRWSECSLNSIKDKLKSRSSSPTAPIKPKYSLPGQMLPAEYQCRFFASRLVSHPIHSFKATICNESLWCQQVTDTDGFELIPIGPALEGTKCKRDDADDMNVDSICLNKECQLLR